MPYHSSCCVVVCCLTFGHCASVSFSPHEFVNEFMRVCIISCMECHFSHRIHTLRSEYRPSIWTELLDHSSFGIRRLRRHRRRCHFFLFTSLGLGSGRQRVGVYVRCATHKWITPMHMMRSYSSRVYAEHFIERQSKSLHLSNVSVYLWFGARFEIR